MAMEDNGRQDEAVKKFVQAWNEATENFEKFIVAHYIARHQKSVSERLTWLQTGLQFALKINDETVEAAFPSLYADIATCYEKLGDHENAKKNHELAQRTQNMPSDKGPFYHGTKTNLEIGGLLTSGRKSNYKTKLVMNHIYFTALERSRPCCGLGQG